MYYIKYQEFILENCNLTVLKANLAKAVSVEEGQRAQHARQGCGWLCMWTCGGFLVELQSKYHNLRNLQILFWVSEKQINPTLFLPMKPSWENSSIIHSSEES